MNCLCCGKEVKNLIVVPIKLKRIIPFQSLCFECDKEYRMKNIEEIERLIYFKKY